jgi:hypothetical protein
LPFLSFESLPGLPLLSFALPFLSFESLPGLPLLSFALPFLSPLLAFDLLGAYLFLL